MIYRMQFVFIIFIWDFLSFELMQTTTFINEKNVKFIQMVKNVLIHKKVFPIYFIDLPHFEIKYECIE